jgi:hypothetical protein
MRFILNIQILLLVLSSTTTTTVLSLPTTPKSISPIHLPLRLIKTTKRHYTKREAETTIIPLIYDIDLSELAVKVKVGTPAQEFLLLFDTGSADTWIPSTQCLPSNGCPEDLHRFDASQSSTYQPSQDKLVIKYGTGSAEGNYFQDVMTFSNEEATTTIKSQTLAIVDKAVGPISSQNISTDADHVILDGILGAGLPGGTVRQDKTYDPFPISLYKAGLIPNPVFSVSINDDGGNVVLGDIDTSETLLTDFVYTNLVESTKRWSVNVQGLQFHNNTSAEESRNFKFNEATPCGIDTGSNFMYLPRTLAYDLARSITKSDKLFSLNEKTGVFNVDCQFQSSLDSVNVYFKSSMKQGDDDTVNINLLVSQLIAKKDSDGKCLFLFIPSDDKFIIGNMLLKQFITVFDFGDIPRIGFAKKEPSTALLGVE